MAGHSDQVVWAVVSKWNAHQRTVRGGDWGKKAHGNTVLFSSEKGNLMNEHSYKYSGFANSKALDLTIDENKIEFGLKTKKGKFADTKMNKGFRRVVNSIRKQGITNYYRPDLHNAALARWTALNRAAKVTNGVLKPTKHRAGRNGAA
jgi:large subunit ribosomal protein L28e